MHSKISAVLNIHKFFFGYGLVMMRTVNAEYQPNDGPDQSDSSQCVEGHWPTKLRATEITSNGHHHHGTQWTTCKNNDVALSTLYDEHSVSTQISLRAFYDGIDNSRRQVPLLNVKVPEDHEFLTKWWTQLDTVSPVLRDSPLAEQEVNSQPYGKFCGNDCDANRTVYRCYKAYDLTTTIVIFRLPNHRRAILVLMLIRADLEEMHWSWLLPKCEVLVV
ncbi:unnamed protein product [Acanthoscelides obtectus]|uniref:Uncharacterized protein n=1 Tax=Acanthoscelides obtectus TaxID=200917 RepID=A0A9P0KFK1_ACAOB|nr:unnamed protein product [Acanthoscelides obtectus]CAK1667462.1 hypothetical protein AOBTE_LOCUS25857 [Acanthoscelides obtectus]